MLPFILRPASRHSIRGELNAGQRCTGMNCATQQHELRTGKPRPVAGTWQRTACPPVKPLKDNHFFPSVPRSLGQQALRKSCSLRPSLAIFPTPRSTTAPQNSALLANFS
jgi:hypothetical protein